jgi:hypothetical protein
MGYSGGAAQFVRIFGGCKSVGLQRPSTSQVFFLDLPKIRTNCPAPPD